MRSPIERPISTDRPRARPARLTRRALAGTLFAASAGLALTSSSGLGIPSARRFADRRALSQAAGAAGERAWLQEPGIEGWFRFESAPAAGLVSPFRSLGSLQTMVVPSIAGGVWNRLVEDAIRPEWFGAANVRGGDDAPALQAAIDALGQRGNTLVLEGDYTISRRLDVRGKSGFRISGPGRISASSAMPVRSDYQCLMFDHCVDFEVADIVLDGGSAVRKGPLTAAHALEIRSCSKFALRRIEVRNSVADCLYMAATADNARDSAKHSHDAAFEDCSFVNGRRQGVSIIQGRKLQFSRCRFAETAGSAPQAGVDLESNSRDLEGAIQDISFNDCVFEANRGYGLLVASEKTPRRIVARRCTFHNNVAGAVSWNGRNGLLEDCLFDGFDGTRAPRGCIDVGANPSAGWLDIVRARPRGIRNQGAKSYFLYVHRAAAGQVRLLDTASAELGHVAHLRAANCTIEGGEFEATEDMAVVLAGTDCSVRNATFRRFKGTVVGLAGDRATVANCRFLDPGAQPAGGAVRLLAGQGSAILSNAFRGAGRQDRTISLAPKASATVRGNTFS